MVGSKPPGCPKRSGYFFDEFSYSKALIGCINRFCSMPISRFTIFTFACLTISVYFAALEKNEDMNGHKMILTFSVQNLLSFPINVFLFF